MMTVHPLLLFAVLLTLIFPAVSTAQQHSRSAEGLLALYDFNQSLGEWIPDQSGLEPSLDLKIADLNAVRRREGSLEIVSETQILSATDTSRLVEVIKRTGGMTIEAWLRPAKLEQTGPARIVTLSRDSSLRDFTLGQDGPRYDVRFRTTENGNNGTPSLASPENSLTTELTHVVYTRHRSGEAFVFINGQRSATQRVPGRLSNWSHFQLGLANERGGQRPWLGELHLVAIYGRALREKEVANHFAAGPEAPTPTQAGSQDAIKVAMFETKIAPLLSEHCLECHDSANSKGGLDLSQKLTALQGGESGPALVAGNASQSLIWQQVEAGDMPHDRPPLSDAETKQLAQWIDDGATWTLSQIDPANYGQSTGARDEWIRRLTQEEYIATVLAATGVNIREEAQQLLPPDLRADGFSNTAYNLGVDLKYIDAYAQLAEKIVDQMEIAEFARRFSKRRGLTDNDMKTLIGQIGKWILRGPLDDYEISVYQGVTTTVASAGGDFDEAVGLVVEAMLQSPRFLYRMENQIGTGGLLPVSDYELASRMSYILWGSSPDSELMKLADQGVLSDSQVFDQQIHRMLNDPRARAQSQRFLSDWLHLDRLSNLNPNLERYPNWNPELAADMQAETLAFFDEVIWNQRLPLSNLLNAQFSFMTPELARHYGIPPKTDGDPSRFMKYDLSNISHRGGVLTQGSTLTVGGDDASMVTRGLLVMHELLRGVVKDPPPCVDTTPVPTEPGVTQRTIAMNRIQNTNCGGCHSRFEPLAFGLEPFDGLGSFHQKDEHGNPLHEDGEILFPGESKPVPFQTTAQLMDLLAKSPRVQQSLTWKLTQFALGRPLDASDVREIESIHSAATEAGGRYTDVMTEILKSDLVQLIQTRDPTSLTQP
jgi:mono/diheme cytochrome c family protein